MFSSRNWDRLYLLLGLSWSVLCPGYMDGAIVVEPAQLAMLLLVMFATAAAPMVLAAVLRVFFSVRLRSRLLADDTKSFAVRKSEDGSQSVAPVPFGGIRFQVEPPLCTGQNSLNSE